MRIGIDASCLPSFVAGAGTYICGLISSLSRVDKKNQYFIFLKQKDSRIFKNLSQNFQLVKLPNYSRPVRIAWQLTAPQKLIAQYKLDVWHSPHYILPKNIQNVYSVVTFHDMTFFFFPHFYSPIKRLFFRKIITDAVSRADELVAVSKTTKNDIQAIFSILPEKVTHVYSGINGEFRPVEDHKTIRQVKLKYDTGDKFILFVGTLEKRKNLPTLLKAFYNLINNGLPDIKLVIVGQKENGLDELIPPLELLGLTDHVKLPGYIPEADLPALYTAASLFVYPSHYEGFGFPVLEAMACGTPVLTSNISATKEISGIEEIQVNPLDISTWTQKMHTVLTDYELKHRLINHGFNQFQKFNWQKTAQQMIEIYNNAKKRSMKFSTSSTTNQRTGKIKLQAKFEMPANFAHLPPISRAILQTLIYSDLFDYPLKISEIHEGLLACQATLSDVQKNLNDSVLNKYIENLNGFYYLKGKRHNIKNRNLREQASTQILIKNRRLLQFVCIFPFVQATALSGAIAFYNCLPEDDIDLFLIVDPRRVWLVYFFLALFLKLVGKRNLVCLNYLYAKKDLTVQDKDFFVAHQIANLLPLAGNVVYEKFLRANSWFHEYLPQSKSGHEKYFANLLLRNWPFKTTYNESPVKRSLEKLFSHCIFDKIEAWVFHLYGSHIKKITRHLHDSVVVEKDQIKLFTHDHRTRILLDFHNRLKNLQEKGSEI